MDKRGKYEGAWEFECQCLSLLQYLGVKNTTRAIRYKLVFWVVTLIAFKILPKFIYIDDQSLLHLTIQVYLTLYSKHFSKKGSDFQ